MKIKNTLGLLACLATSLSVSAQETQTLKIGALVTLSGAGASWGQGMKNAAEIAAAQVNESGGLEVGGKKYKVSVVAYDDKYQANEAVTVANRLVFEDKVKYIIGPVGSAPVLAIQPITEKNKVIVLTLGFTSKALQKDKPYTFRPNVTTAEVSQPQINWLVKTQGVKKVGGLFPNDETGQQIAKDLRTAYKQAGADLVATEFFERDRVDFVPLLTRMGARGIDAIELDGNSPTTAGLIVKQAREIGFTGKILRTGGPATQEIVNVAGVEAAQGMFVHTPIDPGLASTKAYADRYAATYNQPMNGFSPAFYDGTNMLFEAMRRAGSVTDTDAVRDEMVKLADFQGSMGTLNWTGQEVYGINHQLNAPFYVAEVVDGKEVIRARCTVKLCE
ncbi:amino acid ABC transporter substrate-binding protein [Pollutimonas nitritireducens]|uniref:Amino acid ABC transporter substrate-binding protein n=1 Tax=Pollutimonas nitritireducens TaxID=2045209 RepID=A0A2N4UCK2_9BURK|nr:ABC transporter substrate-binding protein [Pollutimonas nitritireducens]PLC52717.1 amino acid ABC transporter substrate-binding protein [Pollutimonas nitritireducens]